MTYLFDYDSHLCCKQLNNEPFCKQSNLATMKSISLEGFALSLALALQFRHQVSVMRELGNGLLATVKKIRKMTSRALTLRRSESE